MSTERHRITKLVAGVYREVDDALAVEEALEIHVDGAPYAVVMRSPGQDLDLVRGFCLTEGIVTRPAALEAVRRCEEPEGENRVLVTLAAAAASPAAATPTAATAAAAAVERADRLRVSRSGCGLCGRELIEQLHRTLPPLPRQTQLSAEVLLERLRELIQTQRVYHETGGTHGAALYDAAGARLAFAEDIGRHNALDKAVGATMGAGALHRARLALVSSRLSFEMVQKAAAAGVEILAGISAATSLGVRLAARQGMTLVGFLRGDRLNVYTHPERLLGAAPSVQPAMAPACAPPACPEPDCPRAGAGAGAGEPEPPT